MSRLAKKANAGLKTWSVISSRWRSWRKYIFFSKTLPSDEKFDLYVQIRRSSKNVTGNIGEAYGRYHYLDSLHYYYSIARGELNETLARLIDARVLDYIAQAEFESL